jgi:serine protease inhibitor
MRQFENLKMNLRNLGTPELRNSETFGTNKYKMTTMRTITTFFCALLMLAVFVSCDRQDNDNTQDLKNFPEKSAQVISSDNQFGLELFQKITALAEKKDNTMISPLSISLALAMTYNGAVGTTKTEMEKTLKLAGLTTVQINNAHKALVNALQSADPDVLLEIANAIYYRKELPVKQDFVTVNKDFYDAEVTALDFNAFSALGTINGWVAQKTRDKIPTIIDQIDPNLVMILLNAIYFNGIWKLKFDEKGTRELSFTFGDGSVKKVATMHRESTFEYTSNNLFQAVQLPYGKGQYQMTVILPNDNKTTGNVRDQMTNNNWKGWMKEFQMKENVVVFMPRFKFSWKMTLNEILAAMGMPAAFNPQKADFSGIASDMDLFISFVIHKTFVDVNENGTEAAAVTAVGVSVTSAGNEPPKIYFNVNRPFLFAISEKSTGTILFIGEMNAPEYK